MVCDGFVSPCEHEMKLSRFLILVDLMSQQNPMETMEGEWVELLQKMTTILNWKRNPHPNTQRRAIHALLRVNKRYTGFTSLKRRNRKATVHHNLKANLEDRNTWHKKTVQA